GVWDDPGILPFRTKMIGHPITRPERTTVPVPMSNVSWVWESHQPDWGLMQGPLKAQAGTTPTADSAYRCHDVLADPTEAHDLGPLGRCAPLVALAQKLYGMMPRDLRPMRKHPEWPANAP